MTVEFWKGAGGPLPEILNICHCNSIDHFQLSFSLLRIYCIQSRCTNVNADPSKCSIAHTQCRNYYVSKKDSGHFSCNFSTHCPILIIFDGNITHKMIMAAYMQ